MRARGHASAAAMLVAMSTAACMVGPDYVAPETPVPAAWDTELTVTGAGAVAADAAWWSSFDDPLLTRLLTQALTANYDLQKAEAAVLEARAVRSRAASGLLPTLDGTSSYERSRNSETLATSSFVPSGAGVVNDRFGSELTTGWEIDLFGKVRRGIEAADAGIGASRASADDVRLALIGEVARTYVDIRGLQRRIDVTREQLRAQRDTLDLTRAKYQAGTGAGLDMVRAESQLATTEAELPPLQASLKTGFHRLGVLTGREPAALTPLLAEPQPIPQSTVALQVGIPADLIRRRPDIRNAERLLAEATANIGVAVADRFPTLTINGNIGIGSRNLGDLLRSDSLIWSVGPQLDIPVFDGGRRQAEVEVQKAKAEQARAQYRATVLAALEEVENALVSYSTEEERRRALAQSAATSDDALALAQELYIKGLSPFLDVLVAQRTLYQAQVDLAVSEANVSIDLVALYKALGGGWEVPCCTASPATTPAQDTISATELP